MGIYYTGEQSSAPSAPSSGYVALYFKSDGLLYWKDDAGNEYAPVYSGGSASFVDLTVTGNTIIGNAIGDTLTVNVGAWTLGNAVTVTGTWANLGTVTTVDINGGTIDGTAIGGTTPAAGAFTTLGMTDNVRINKTGGLLAFYATGGATRTGYIQEATGDIAIVGELAGSKVLTYANNTPITTVSSTGLAVTGAISATKATSGDVATFTTGTVGSESLYVYVDANTAALFNTAAAGAGRNGILLNPTNVIVDINAATVGTFSSTGLAVTGAISSTGNVGVGTTANQWSGGFSAIQIAENGAIAANDFGAPNMQVLVANNAYYDGVGYKYQVTGGYSTQYLQANGQHIFYTAPTGTAGNTLTFTQAMTLDANSNLSIGNTLTVTGGTITTGNTNSLALTTGGGTVLDLRYAASSVNYLQIIPSAATGANVILRAAGTDTNVTLYYDSQGTGSHNFRTGNAGSNGNQFVISNTNSAVNYLDVSGSSAGSSPYVVVNGSDTNISLNVSSKGSGNFNVYTGGLGSLVAQFAHVASAVNYWYLYGNTTGNTPALTVAGTDTNISAGFSTKGTGSHLFYTNGTANLQAAITHTASAVNYLQLTGAATGGAAPTLSAQGSDTNINIAVIAKGTGSVYLNTGGGNQVQVTNTASANRYITLTGSNGGNPTIGTSAGSLAITPDVVMAGALTVASPITVTGNNIGSAATVWFGADSFGGGAINVPTGEAFAVVVNNTGVASFTSAGLDMTGFIAGTEQTAPAAPAANGYRIFAQDNGAGKTQLMVIFGSGAAQQIAIEP